MMKAAIVLVRGLFIAAALLLLAGTIAPHRAEATVVTCSMSTTGIVFSGYDTVTKAQIDSTGSVSVTCTGAGGNDALDLEASGGNTGTCSTPRRMRNGTAALDYQVYSDSSRSAVWCDGAGRIRVTFNWNQGATQTKTYLIYGRVFASQNPASAGAYTDSLTANLRQSGITYATTSVPMNGSVTGTCSLSAASLGFGTYNPGAVLDSTADVSVNCTNATPYTVSLNGGLNLSGGTRRMAGPSGSFLSYGLFRDSARTSAWGDGTSLGAKVSGTGSGNQQNLPVYGRIGANQLVRAGSYSDSVQVTIEY